MRYAVHLRYGGVGYWYEDEWPHGKDGLEYIYEEGNYSCDCNRSEFIRRHCDPGFPELECGNEIGLVDLVIL